MAFKHMVRASRSASGDETRRSAAQAILLLDVIAFVGLMFSALLRASLPVPSHSTNMSEAAHA